METPSNKDAGLWVKDTSRSRDLTLDWNLVEKLNDRSSYGTLPIKILGDLSVFLHDTQNRLPYLL